MKIRSEFCTVKELQERMYRLEEIGCKVVTIFPCEMDPVMGLGRLSVARVIIVYREKV